MKMTFARAYKRFPACCMGAWDEQRTVTSLVYAVDHELTMFKEGQDGCITNKERAECSHFMGWLQDNGINPDVIVGNKRF